MAFVAAMGACGYLLSNRAVFVVTAALVAPALLALARIRGSEIDPKKAHGGEPELRHHESFSLSSLISIAGAMRSYRMRYVHSLIGMSTPSLLLISQRPQRCTDRSF